ncbi:2-iminobutanoate/2-iminopropanoate deaminase [Sinosporangium album]|uniref:2-iminobutanoate/2-iminopropanoate deaminase n=1 Tax=Sinosporangium album TaxID=504805 RepID=A0A1G8E3P7_9ACTN|nr:RidA family protein [Sinosporangium album]SDH64566.1 2-iminobutanoate/2-iminopropanoate deaminase [Sinosporangium album]
MARELSNPADLHPATTYSHLAIAQGQTLVFVAGQVPFDKDRQIVGGDNLREQTLAAMANVHTALKAAGCDWDNVVRRTIYTTLPHSLEEITTAVRDATGGAANPPQSIVGVSGLALPGLLIEVECTAVRD